MIKKISLFLGPILAIILFYWLKLSPLPTPICTTAAITFLCAVWWVFEPIPIPATSLIPIACFPLFGVLSDKEVAQAYGDPLILLLLGGFILSIAMEKSGTHRRIALFLINLLGGKNPRRVVFGFMLASAIISMWISNAATTLMLLPIALATLDSYEEKNSNINAALLMGIAFAASIGGIGSPVGTAPNTILMGVYKAQTHNEISFLTWMYWGVPIAIILLPFAAYWLTRKLPKSAKINIPETGPWREEEIKVLIIFALTIILWITRTEPYGGWKGLLGLKYANDASIGLIAVISLFIIPNGNGGKILDWESANKVPWGVILLFAGGLCIALAFDNSGLSQLLSYKLKGITNFHPILLIFGICIFTTFMSEVTSNTAQTAMLMPILAGVAKETNINPLLLMIPACVAASAAFMLPAGTPPNAIVFGTGKIKSKEMALSGFAINIIGSIIITAVCYIVLIQFGVADKIANQKKITPTHLSK